MRRDPPSAVLPVAENMSILCSRCRRFEADDQPITCVVLEGGPCSACRERTMIRQKIKQLEEELAKLKAKHDAVTSTMNAIHDPFIHKLPPEIGSHIFRLSLPTLSNGEHLEAILNLYENRSSAEILNLGAVCRKWRQLAWATPDLWNTLYLRIGLETRQSLAESLPDLVREWLERSGSLPLTIFFRHHPAYRDESSDDDENKSEVDRDTLEIAIGLVIKTLSFHSQRWQNLSLMTTPEMFRRFSGSVQPNQVVGLGLRLCDDLYDLAPPNFMMESEFAPTRLMLGDFPLASINIRWDNITHITLRDINTEAYINILQRATGLEYYNISIHSRCKIREPIVHPRLRSLHVSSVSRPGYIEDFLGAITLPSLEEWTQNMCNQYLPVAAMVSFFKRSGCCLKVLHLATISQLSKAKHLTTLLRAIPTLERIHLSSNYINKPKMDNVLAQIFLPAPGSGSTLVEGHTADSFLPRLQFMECNTAFSSPFSWDRIPQLYRQGHRRSLVLKTMVKKSDISDETALQFLQLADEGLDLQIFDFSIGGCFLENFRKRMCEQGV